MKNFKMNVHMVHIWLQERFNLRKKLADLKEEEIEKMNDEEGKNGQWTS